MRAELSFRQRVYLLWTFRHFRHLSAPLLNSRQRALVDDLFQSHADGKLYLDDPYGDDAGPVIGVVENFAAPLAVRKVSPKAKEATRDKLVAKDYELGPKPNWKGSGWPRFASSGLAKSALASTAGAVLLCTVSVAGWHRMHGMPASETHRQEQIQPLNLAGEPKLSASADATGAARADSMVTPAAAFSPLTAGEDAAGMASIEAGVSTGVPVGESTRGPIPAAIPKNAVRVRDRASISKVPLSSPDGAIQATRAPLHFVYPVYEDVRARGAVALTAQVDRNGMVRGVRVISGNRGLASAAVRAVRLWRYRPFVKDGQAVATETNIVISFISDDAISMNYPPSFPSGR